MNDNQGSLFMILALAKILQVDEELLIRTAQDLGVDAEYKKKLIDISWKLLKEEVMDHDKTATN